ncbi:MAG: NAD-dependent epimerase/dehydratase family protein [Arachnia sp.]
MRAVVLGVNGLTGRAIAAELAAAGWEVVGTGRDKARFPTALGLAGVEFIRSDRNVPVELGAVLSSGADVVVDCVCYTADQARLLLGHTDRIGSIVVLSSKAVYVDAHGRHSNSDEPPDFGAPVSESCAVMEPDFSGDYLSRDGYGANKVAMECILRDSAAPVSILRPSRIHGAGAARPREWYVVTRLMNGQRQFPLAQAGRTGNHPTAARNLARLVRVCAEQPGARVLNAADPGTPTAAEIVTSIGAAYGETVEVVDDELRGWNPWDTWPPFYLDMRAAQAIGYEAAGTYRDTVSETVDELVQLDPESRRALDTDPYFAR